MQNLYKVLQNPSLENLKQHSLDFFDKVISKYPSQYIGIISYIKDCYNYQTPLLIEEKDWRSFLNERRIANNLDDSFIDALINYKCPEIVLAIDAFFTYQKEPTFQTLIAKQNLRKDMLVVIQDSSAKVDDKQKANALVTTLDDEIDNILERLRSEQKKIGNYKGFDAIAAKAKTFTQITISHFIK